MIHTSLLIEVRDSLSHECSVNPYNKKWLFNPADDLIKILIFSINSKSWPYTPSIEAIPPNDHIINRIYKNNSSNTLGLFFTNIWDKPHCNAVFFPRSSPYLEARDY